MSRLGDEIAKLRLAKGLTPKQLGKQLGVAESFVLDVESGRRVVNDALLGRIGKILGPLGSAEGMAGGLADEPVRSAPAAPQKPVAKPAPVAEKPLGEVNAVWSEALGNVLKQVPVYGLDLKKVLETRALPIQNNKVEGFAKDKVLYLKVEDTDMMGFRMNRDDMLLGTLTQEFTGDGFYLVEVDGSRVLRQVKLLEMRRYQVASHRGVMEKSAFGADRIRFLARFTRLETTL